MEQLLLFQQPEEERLAMEVKQLREQVDKMRRAQFAKISDISRRYTELLFEFESLKASICRYHHVPDCTYRQSGTQLTIPLKIA
jgi:ABC-type phosphate transport system auxiliary subunit